MPASISAVIKSDAKDPNTPSGIRDMDVILIRESDLNDGYLMGA